MRAEVAYRYTRIVVVRKVLCLVALTLDDILDMKEWLSASVLRTVGIEISRSHPSFWSSGRALKSCLEPRRRLGLRREDPRRTGL